MITRQLVIAAVLMLPPFGSVEGRGQAPIAAEASLSTAGPYGEIWELKVDRNGKCALDSSAAFGAKTLRTTFSMTLEQRQALHRMVVDVRFFDLPKSISPPLVPFHAPDYRLTVTLGSQRHSVNLYDPENVNTPEAARFKRLWDHIFASSPEKPNTVW